VLLARAQDASGDELWGIARALGEDSSSECLKGLAILAQSDDIDRRRAALYALGKNEKGAVMRDVVLAAFGDPAFQVVWAAVEAAAGLQIVEANERIVQLLEKPNPVRRAAVAALRHIWHPSNFEPTLNVFRKSRKDQTRKEAAWTLRQHASSENWSILFDEWKDDEVPRHRIWACQLAAMHGGRSVTRQVANLSQDSDGHVRAAAEAAFRELDP